MSVRLPLVGGTASAARGAHAHGARAARMTPAGRTLTVASRDGSAEAFARPLAEALRAHGVDLGVVSDRALAIELAGLLDVWVGARPLPGGDAIELAAHASCQLELRTGHETVARLLAREFADQLGDPRDERRS